MNPGGLTICPYAGHLVTIIYECREETSSEYMLQDSGMLLAVQSGSRRPRYSGTRHNHCAKTPDGEATDRLAEKASRALRAAIEPLCDGVHPHGYPASVTRRRAWYARLWQYRSH